MKKTSVFGLDENIACLLCYALTFFSGIIILVMEKDNKTVRFHALQSTLWFMTISVATWVLNFLTFIPLLGYVFGFAAWALGTVMFISWLFLMFMAVTGRQFKLPIIGEVAFAQVNK